MAKRKITEPQLYRAICHTRCYWLDTLWEPGDEYEGEFEPGKHFSDDSTFEPEKPPRQPGDDPRSNDELKKALKEHPFNFTAPKSWGRKQLWMKLRDLEMADSKMADEEDAGPKPNVTAPARNKPVIKRKAAVKKKD